MLAYERAEMLFFMGSYGYTEKVIISVGGSLIVPNGGIDTQFLSNLNQFIRSQIAANPQRQFFLVSGGGGTARQYRDAGKAVIGQLTDEDLDWIGVHATRLNAHLIRTIFHDIAHPTIIEHYDIIRKAEEPVVVASGWKPGWSTDFDAVMLCEDYGATTILNLSNIKQVYDKDPKEFPDAKPIERMTWSEFRLLVGDTWIPGMNVPFDPIAAKKAQELGIKVIVINGDDFENINNYFLNKSFLGTVIDN